LRLTELRTGGGSQRHRLYLTVTNRSGRNFDAPVPFLARRNDGPRHAITKHLQIAGGGEPGRVAFPLPDITLSPFKKTQIIEVELEGTNLWDRQTIRRTFTVSPESLWNVGFDGPLQISEDSNGIITIRARIKTTKTSFNQEATYSYDARLTVATRTEIVRQLHATLTTDDTEVVFSVNASVLKQRTGERNLYFGITLDGNEVLEESNERDNRRETQFRIH
jgi:hypothetical protein